MQAEQDIEVRGKVVQHVGRRVGSKVGVRVRIGRPSETEKVKNPLS